jgi:hypothetical protein
MRVASAVSGIIVHLVCWGLFLMILYALSMASFLVLGTVVKGEEIFWWAAGWTAGFLVAVLSAVLMLARRRSGAKAPAVLLLLCSLAGILAAVYLSLSAGGFRPHPLSIFYVLAFAVQGLLTILFLAKGGRNAS